MALPAPDLDDRRFQQLVDDAKRMVQQRCKDWTDHNVSDPGITLIELFAWMTDQVVYRLNRVPDRNYVKFLDLLGVRLYPATAARVDVTFWLSAPQEEVVTVPSGIEVCTEATDVDDEVVFTTVEERPIVPCSLTDLMTGAHEATPQDRSQTLKGGAPFHCFGEVPQPGDHMLFGLSNAVPACAVTFRVECDIEGVGVDPERPPLVWEAWDGKGWAPCELEADSTGGLNKAGDVTVHVPRGHAVSVIEKRRAGWVRCRVVPAVDGQPSYSASPRIIAAEAFTVGGTAAAVNAEVVTDEVIGLSEGVAGQRFRLERRPAIPAVDPTVLEVAAGHGWDEWQVVRDFAESGEDDPHFIVDWVEGEVVLGPVVREADGTLRHYGRVPPKGAPLRLRSYWSGGGRQGNVARRTVTALRSTVPFVSGVTNRHPASGGVDAEDIANAKLRGPILLRTRNRAVTAEDYEQLAREAAPEVARVRCVTVDRESGEDASGSCRHLGAAAARVLVVPAASDEAGKLRFEQLVPADTTLHRIAEYLNERRMIGSRVVVEPPIYQGITVVARLRARPRANLDRLREDALGALYRYFHPICGGPDRTGWPFGRPIHVGEVYAVLQELPGTEYLHYARLFPADPISGKRSEEAQRLEIARNALVFSFEHQVQVD